MPLRNQR